MEKHNNGRMDCRKEVANGRIYVDENNEQRNDRIKKGINKRRHKGNIDQ